MKLCIKITRQTDDSYKAFCPALPGCWVVADSIEEARERIQAAVSGYLSSLEVALPRELSGMLKKEEMACGAAA